MRSVFTRSLGYLVTAATPLAAWAAPFTPGSIVVTRIGDGSAITDPTAAAPVFIDEFDGNGNPYQSIALPAAGASDRLVLPHDGGGTAQVGHLTRSIDGQYLMIGGYDAAVGTAAVSAQAAPSPVPRIVARLDPTGTVETLRFTDNSFGTQFITSVASASGSTLYVAGRTNNDRTGVRIVNWGAGGTGTSARLNTNTAVNARVVNIARDTNGNLQLFLGTSNSNSPTMISKIGTGLPTTTNSAANNPAGFVNGTGLGVSAYDYWFKDANTLYVAAG